MTEIPQIISRKLRVVLVDFFCLVCSLRELHSSLMSDVGDEGPLTANQNQTVQILLFILVLISGLNSWAIASDLSRPFKNP